MRPTAPDGPLHDDEFEIDLPLVRALLARSAPKLAGRTLRTVSSQGSSNALFRLGDDLLVRLPRQPGGSDTIAKEARWLPRIADALPVAVPHVVAVGEPGLGYPERWSVVRWIEGRSPGVSQPAGAPALASDLAATVRALRSMPVPAEALRDPELQAYRGAPLRSADTMFRGYLAECRGLPLDLDLGACERVWTSATALPAAGAAVASQWLHGDLTAENLLLVDGHLAAVLDFGGLALGDPAVDLIVAWDVLDPAGRAVFRAELDVDEDTWMIGRAWALALAIMTFPYYWHTMPARCAARLAAAQAVLADSS